jgi:hypothetical protein
MEFIAVRALATARRDHFPRREFPAVPYDLAFPIGRRAAGADGAFISVIAYYSFSFG